MKHNQKQGASAKPAAPRTETGVAAPPDDLTQINGIGPRISTILNEGGITTYDAVPSGPLSGRVRVRLVAEGVDDATLEELAQWGVDHCPVCNALERPVPITVEVATN